MNLKRRQLVDLLLVLAACLPVSCSALGFGERSPHEVSGTWEGSLTVQGEAVEGSLSIQQDGRVLSASFVSRGTGLAAQGRGDIDDDGDVSLELRYEIDCPGTAVFDGRLEDEGSRLTGVVEARDCTGVASGTFDFRRQPR